MEKDSTPLLIKGSAEGYGTASPAPGPVEHPQIEQAPKAKATTTRANALDWTGRGMLATSLVGFIISASGVVGWPVAAGTLALMVTGAGLCITSEIKKECSRPATPFHENRGGNANASSASTAAVEKPAVVPA